MRALLLVAVLLLAQPAALCAAPAFPPLAPVRTFRRDARLPRPAPRSPPLLFTLPRVCRSPACHARAVALLRSAGCCDVLLLDPLRLVRASCPPSRHALLRASPRFARVTPDARLRLLAPVAPPNASRPLAPHRRRPFSSITRLAFARHATAALTPAGRSIHLAAQRAAARCSRASGAGVTVYVIDTGCRATHEQLRGRVAALPAPGSRFRTGHDDHGHGTHVAATIAGRDFGLAPRARVVCIKALSERNEGSGADVIAGIQHVIRVHPKRRPGIVSISLGVKAERRYRALDAAIGRAARHGLIPIVAAGNSGRDACTFTPARAPSAVTVAAVGVDGKIASFSNWGKCVTVGAPGVAVWSAVAKGDDIYGVSSGTSMAAPFVSGLVALRLAEGQIGVDEVKAWLREIGEGDGLPVVSVRGFCEWKRRRR